MLDDGARGGRGLLRAAAARLAQSGGGQRRAQKRARAEQGKGANRGPERATRIEGAGGSWKGVDGAQRVKERERLRGGSSYRIVE